MSKPCPSYLEIRGVLGIKNKQKNGKIPFHVMLNSVYDIQEWVLLEILMLCWKLCLFLRLRGYLLPEAAVHSCSAQTLSLVDPCFIFIIWALLPTVLCFLPVYLAEEASVLTDISVSLVVNFGN